MTRAWLVGLAVAATAGCGGSQRNEDFVPSEDAARTALEAYLSAWKRGDISQSVPGTRPPVLVADELRAKGRTLSEFMVLGPVPADVPRCFAARLTLGNPREEVRERYVVVGADPVWVWRYDDYVMITHWEHAMPVDKKAKK
ncbi:MAG TPA: hypothetical protein VFG68_20105 [Fimbriiglobus sp.]|nr:hypothetical protein [Fimbriiglobus sp.]